MSGALGDDARRARQGLPAREHSRGAEPGTGAGAFQRPLRARSQAQPTRGVDLIGMTTACATRMCQTRRLAQAIHILRRADRPAAHTIGSQGFTTLLT